MGAPLHPTAKHHHALGDCDPILTEDALDDGGIGIDDVAQAKTDFAESLAVKSMSLCLPPNEVLQNGLESSQSLPILLEVCQRGGIDESLTK